MRAVQINDLSGSYGTIKNQAIWDKVARWHLDMILVTLMVSRNGRPDPDPEASKPETREFVMGKGLAFGFVRVPEWTGSNEAQLAALLESDLNAFGLDNIRHPRPDPCFVMANAEAHTFDPIKFEGAWRKTRPTRATGWGLEGLQGGRISDQVVSRLNADAFWTTYPECYRGDMTPQAQDAVKDNLRGRGLQRIGLYYDFKLGAPDWMDGCGYVMERLP